MLSDFSVYDFCYPPGAALSPSGAIARSHLAVLTVDIDYRQVRLYGSTSLVIRGTVRRGVRVDSSGEFHPNNALAVAVNNHSQAVCWKSS